MTLPISVVVVNHNGRDYLDRCLAALLAAQPAEVLLVDSGSTDGSARAAAGRYPVRLIELGANLGPSVARNRGLAAASQELVLLVDNDVEVLPGCVERLVAHLERHADVALLQARSLLGSPAGPVHYDGGSFHMLGLVALRNWYRPQAEAAGSGLVPCDVAIALCCLGRRSALLAAQGFDEAMLILFEDLGLSYALKMMGHEVAVAEDALCVHLAGTAGLSTRGEARTYAARRTFLHSRNRWIFLLTHYRWRTLLVLLPAFVLYGLVHLGFALASRHGVAWLRGKWALVGLVPHLRQRRRALQRIRCRSDRALLGCPALTFNPGLATGGWRNRIARGLDRTLALYHATVQWLL